jgi:hypothetical protein
LKRPERPGEYLCRAIITVFDVTPPEVTVTGTVVERARVLNSVGISMFNWPAEANNTAAGDPPTEADVPHSPAAGSTGGAAATHVEADNPEPKIAALPPGLSRVVKDAPFTTAPITGTPNAREAELDSKRNGTAHKNREL